MGRSPASWARAYCRKKLLETELEVMMPAPMPMAGLRTAPLMGPAA